MTPRQGMNTLLAVLLSPIALLLVLLGLSLGVLMVALQNISGRLDRKLGCSMLLIFILTFLLLLSVKGS